MTQDDDTESKMTRMRRTTVMTSRTKMTSRITKPRRNILTTPESRSTFRLFEAAII